MASTLQITSNEPGPLGKLGPYEQELVKIVGATSAAGDTGTLVTKFVVPIGSLGGAFSVTYSAATSGGTATFTANAAQASTTTYTILFGYAK